MTDGTRVSVSPPPPPPPRPRRRTIFWRALRWTVVALGWALAVLVMDISDGEPRSIASFIDPNIRAERVQPWDAGALEAGVPEFEERRGEARPYYVRQRWVDETTLVVSLWHWGIADLSLDALHHQHETDSRLVIEPVWGRGWDFDLAPLAVLAACGCDRLDRIDITLRNLPQKTYEIEVRERMTSF